MNNDNALRAKRAMQALRAADQRGVGQVAGGMGAEATDRLADLDACTRPYRAWSPFLIPGLLQTDSYTASAIKSRTPSLDPSEIERRVAHRRRRAASFLARRAGLKGTFAWFLIGEAAITRPLMSLHSHGEQLRHLLAVSENYDNLIIQVLREDPPARGIVEPFELFHLDPGPLVGHLETVVGGFYTITSEDIARLHSVFSDMLGWAMPPADTREYIKGVLDECWGHTTERRSSSPHTATQATASMSPDLPPAPSA